MKKIVHEEQLHDRGLLLAQTRLRPQRSVIGVVKNVGTGYICAKIAGRRETIRSYQISISIHIVPSGLGCPGRKPWIILAVRAVLQSDELGRNKCSLEPIG